VNGGYYIVVFPARTTTCCVVSATGVLLLVVAWGACPHAQEPDVTAAQRREAIARAWRDTKPSPVPLVTTETAWTVTLPAPPVAPGALDEQRVYVPLRSGLLVAINRETGILEWHRSIEGASSALAADGAVYVVLTGAIRALDAVTGEDRWTIPVHGMITAPLVSDTGWLIALTAPGEALAIRAVDGQVIWRRPLGAASPHRAVAGESAWFISLADGRVVALAMQTGEPLWERQLTGTISEPAVAPDRVFVGSTDNFLYAFDADTGRQEWRWRNGGDVIGAAADGDLVYFASLDNIIRAVNRGNGNQRWKKPTGTRPVAPPRAFGGVVVVPGLMPAITVFVGQTGAVMGTQTAAGDLVGPPLIDPTPRPFRVSLVSITREGVVEALRPAGLMFRDAALVPIGGLPGRPLARERLSNQPAARSQ
jgi:outer membrane protein assembly factor BamB